MSGPKVHLAPDGAHPYLGEAIRLGGGELVAAAEAEALIWAGADPAALRSLLDAYPQIRWVQLLWAGVERYAAAGVFDHKHMWTSGKGICALPVAEHALALALAGLRNLHRFAAARCWGAQAGSTLSGSRVTIFGGGGVGGALVKLLQPFDCHITIVRRHPRPLDGAGRVLGFAERQEAIGQADVIFLALALTPETIGLFGRAEFALMRPHAWLINVARGPLVVTDDLVVALRERVIGGAALDVTDPEPLPEGHPLWALPNCLITPHTANTDAMARPLLVRRIAENIRRFAAGERLLGRVDPDLGY